MKLFLRLLCGSVAFLLSLLLAGCVTTIRMPDAEESEEIRSNRQALVLMRIETRFENEPLDSFSLGNENFTLIKSSSFEGGRKLRSLWPYHSLSDEALADGWIYFLLEPGSHFLHIKPPPYTKNVDFIRGYAPYWLVIPKGKQAVYAGSIMMTCRSKRLIFGRIVDGCHDLRVADEGSRAHDLAARFFSELDGVTTSLVQQYPVSVTSLSGVDLQPPEIVMHDLTQLESPDWQKRGISRTTGIGNTAVDDGEPPLQGAGMGGGDPRFYAGLAMLYILYLPIGLTAGAISGSVNQERWGECIQDLTAGSRAVGIDRLFLQQFEAESNSAKSDSGSPEITGNRPRSRLEVTFHRLAIRECIKRNTFCPEIAVRATLRNDIEETPIYDAVYAYSGGRIEAETPAVQIRAAKGAACREMDDYCSDTGRQAFYDELRHGIIEISKSIMKDLGLRYR